MRKNIGLILSVVFVFLILYYPPIIRINILHVLALISYYGIYNNRELKTELNYVYAHSKLLLAIFVFSLIIFIINDTVSNISGLFLQYFELIPICIYCNYYISKKSELGLGDIIIFAAVLQSILSIAAFINPQVQSFFIDQYMRSGFNDIFEKMAGWRMYGYSYILAYSMPIIQSIIASFCVYKAVTKHIHYMIPVPLIVFSSIINARTGIVIFIVGTITVFLALFFSGKKNNMFKIAISMFLLTTIPTIMLYMLGDSETLYWILEGTDDIQNLSTGGTYERTSYFSYATNSANYRLPEGFFSVMFGTGNSTTRGNSQYLSDVGFINQIWSAGIIGCVMLLIFFLGNTKKIIAFYKTGKEAYILTVGSVVILIISNIKGNAFAWNELTELWFLIYTQYLINRKLSTTSQT